MSDLREEHMPRLNHSLRFRIFASAAALLALAVAGPRAGAQDAPEVAAAANAKLGALQKQLAAGKNADGKDNPNLKWLRVDKFEAAGNQLKVTGVFLDPGTEPGVSGFSPAFESVQNDLPKMVGAGNVGFNWNGIVEVGAIDKEKMSKTKFALPHVALQNAANAAGVDRVLAAASAFGPTGDLVLSGFRGDEKATDEWLTGPGARALAGHPAVRVEKDAPRVVFDMKPTAWPLTAAAIQKLLAGSNDAAVRRLRADRAYFVYEGAEPKFTVAGVRLGEDKLDDIALQDTLRRLWPEVLGGTKPVRLTLAFGAGLVEPVAQLRAAVLERPALDGVRVDPGADFGPAGEFRLAGLQPGLSAEQLKELNDAYQSVLKALVAKGGASDRYKPLETSPVSVAGMKAVPVNKLKDDLRAWAIRNKDDVRLNRLYFIDDLAPIAQKHYAVAKDGGGLVLVYQVAAASDLSAVRAEFAQLFQLHFPQGLPDDKVRAIDASGAVDDKNKEPLLPGLTAELRKVMARDQKTWYGVLIERGYFDAADRYTIAGVVDAPAQNAELAKLLDRLKADGTWGAYFTPAPNAPALTVIPMREMLDRVKRVTPAYPVFDGMRVEAARYDAVGNLVFDAHIVGLLDRDAPPLLAQLMRAHPTYRRRAPADKQVLIARAGGPPYSDDQVANFSLAYGAKLLAKANPSAADKAKAEEWLDIARLHFPNEAGVWFLSAYFNHVTGDAELTRRDLYRVIDLEGSLAFNGPAQRRRRYEAAKDFQGPVRNDLEALWLLCFREVKDGARPITLVQGK